MSGQSATLWNARRCICAGGLLGAGLAVITFLGVAAPVWADHHAGNHMFNHKVNGDAADHITDGPNDGATPANMSPANLSQTNQQQSLGEGQPAPIPVADSERQSLGEGQPTPTPLADSEQHSLNKNQPTPTPVAASEQQSLSQGKIDICRYDSESFDDLKALVKARGLGKELAAIARALSDDPEDTLATWEQQNDKELHHMTTIPLGHTYAYHTACRQDFGNIDIWFFLILENEDGIIDIIDVDLLYYDENFARRNETINAQRYLFSRDIDQIAIVQAVNSMGRARPYSREAMREEMIAGGFWPNRSCETAETITDNYTAPPVPPDHLYALLYAYALPSPLPHVSITFSKPSGFICRYLNIFCAEAGAFLHAKSTFGEDQSGCFLDNKIYRQQSNAFFLEEYPKSWVAKLIMGKLDNFCLGIIEGVGLKKEGLMGQRMNEICHFLTKSFILLSIPSDQ